MQRNGFTHDDDLSYLMLRCEFASARLSHAAPDGFVVRPLAGSSELEAYTALHRRAFESTTMTTAWRERSLGMSQYVPSLDLVAADGEGRLIGFCVGWLAPGGGAVQIEPLGVDPQYRALGISRALMEALFSAARNLGATTVTVETASDRAPALAAYKSAGFDPWFRTVRKGRWAQTDDAKPGSGV